MHLPPHARPKRPRFAPALLAAALSLACAASARAADWYLAADQASPHSWNTLSAWKSSPDGSGSSPAALLAGDTYATNNKILRTPEGSADATFAGGLLRLTGASGVLALKTNSPFAAIVPELEVSGGKIVNYNGGVTRLSVGRLDALADTSTQIASASGRTVDLAVTGKLVGSGELRVAGGGSTARLSVADAIGFTGQLRVSGGTLDFDAPWASSGALVIDGGVLALDQPVTVAALTINGAPYAAGTHGPAQFAAAGHSAQVTGSGGSITVAPPTTWYLSANQPQYQNWDQLSAWKSAANGTGSSPTVIRPIDTFDLNGFDVRTYDGNHSKRFEGILRSVSSASDLIIKTTSGAKSTVHHLIASAGPNSNAGRINHNTSGVVYLRLDTFENLAGSYTVFSDANNNRTLDLSIGRLLGHGITRFEGGGGHRISIDDATAYTGALTLASGTFDFNSDFSSAGTFVVGASSNVVLDQALTFTGLTVVGQEYPIGHYPLSDLQAAHPGRFTGTSGGSITVRGPLDWYLTTGQVNPTDHWHLLAHWNSASDGSGSAPGSINPIDNYINQTSNRTVRAPSVASTFGGGALVLRSGGRLMLRAPAGAVTSIPTLDTGGGASIYNGPVGVQQILDVGRWTATAGTTTLTTNTGGSGGSFDLRVHHLRGPGNITLASGSAALLKVDHGAQLTGTFTVGTGSSLALGQTLGLGGPLVLQSGATVALGQHWLYVRALTVAGVSKAPGIHSVASLGSAFSGTGSVVVYTPTSDSPQMFGVNLAGAEFAGHAFWQNDPAVWQYYKDKGLTLVRLPIKWHRIQSSLSQPVSFTKLDECIAQATAHGMKVIIDMHDYADYGGAGKIGSSAVPVSAFVNLWTQIAEHYKNNDTIYGYDLMNEPQGISPELWADAAQQAVIAIRKIDAKRYILVEGMGASNAQHFRSDSTSSNRFLDIRDPIGRLVYSAHSYWDYQGIGGDGIYQSNDVPHPQIGVNHVRPFVEWLKNERPYAFGNIGEFAVPNNYHQAGWNEALGNFLQYLRDNGLSSTYWAGGANWSHPAPTVCHPHSSVNGGGDKPQMSVLEQFNNE